MNGLWYQPAGVHRLHQATRAALDEIGSITFDDPLTADARHAVINLRTTLEEVWMPSLERIHNSPAMVEWRRIYDGGHGPVRIVNALSRGHRDPVDLRLRQLDLILAELAAIDDLGYPPETLTRLDALLQWISTREVSVSIERLEALLAIIEQLDWMEEGGLVAINPLRRHNLAVIFGAYLTTVAGFGAAIGNEAQTVDRHELWTTRSPVLAHLIADHPHLIDMEALAAVTRNLLTFNKHLGKWSADSHQVDRWKETNALLAIVAQSPELIERVVDADTLLALVTDHYLDPVAVEEILAMTLTNDLRHGLETLGRLTEIAGDDNLSFGARRGIARGFGILFGHLAPHLDRRIGITVSVGGDLVEVGSYDAISRLLGQVLDDETSQMILGLAMSAMRQERMIEVEQLLSEADLQPAGAALAVSSALADVTRIMKLIESARDSRDELLALRHAAAVARSSSVVQTLGSFVPGGRIVGTVVATTASISVRETLADKGRRVGGQQLAEDWALESILFIVELPAMSITARRALGLDHISESTWREIRELIVITEQQPDRRAEVVPRLRGLGVDDRHLDQYINTVRAVSGEMMFE